MLKKAINKSVSGLDAEKPVPDDSMIMNVTFGWIVSAKTNVMTMLISVCLEQDTVRPVRSDFCCMCCGLLCFAFSGSDVMTKVRIPASSL